MINRSLFAVPNGYILPKGWNIVPLKDCFYISKEPSTEKNPIVLSLARAGVKIRDISNNEGQIAASYDNYNVVKPGDLLLNPMDLYSGANCSLSEVRGVISPAYIKLRATRELNPKFYDYFFKVQYWTMAMFAHGKGVSFDNRWTINSEGVLNYLLPVPPKAKQDKIATYLNNKCAQIDRLIEIEESQIACLQAYEREVITDILTNCNHLIGLSQGSFQFEKDLNSDLTVIPLKFLLSEPMMYGANETGVKNYSEGDYRYIRITDIDNDGILKDTDDNQYLARGIAKMYSLAEGDLLFARSGGTVGKTYLHHFFDKPCAFAGYLIKAKCNQSILLPEYLYYYTKSSIYEAWKDTIFIQATIQNIGASKYSVLPVLVDSISNQTTKIKLIKNKIRAIHSIISAKRKKSKLLGDYKKSLIYEYVTGKKELA